MLRITALALLIASSTPALAAPSSAPLSKLPIAFIPNAGQTDRDVLYHVKSAGPDAFFTRDGVVYRQAPDARGAWSAVRVRVEGARPGVRIEPLQPLDGKVSFFLGNDPQAWRAALPTWGGLAYRAVLPGVDMLWSGKDGRLKSDIIVAPGVDVATVRLRVEGAECVGLGADGSLHLGTLQGDIVEQAPVAWQRGAAEGPVKVSFVLLADGLIGFEAQGRDPAAELVIDPVLDFATYLGGSAEDGITWVEENRSATGDVVVAGRTRSPDFPAVAGAYTAPFGSWDAFVALLSLRNGIVSSCTYYGGSGDESVAGRAIATFGVSGGGLYSILGTTTSPDLPMVRASLDPSYDGGGDVYWAQFDATSVLYSSYWGGTGLDEALGSGFEAFWGRTTSPDLPPMLGPPPPGWVAPFRSTLAGASDGFLALGGSWGLLGVNEYLAATHVGGSGDDEVRRAFTTQTSSGRSNSVVLLGRTWSPDFPTHAAAFDRTLDGPSDAFLLELRQRVAVGPDRDDPPIQAFERGTLIGGSGDDAAMAVVQSEDVGRSLGIAGWTDSPDYPLVNGLSPAPAGGKDAMISILSDGWDALKLSTTYGGSGDEGPDIAWTEFLRHGTLVGTTTSPDLPLLNPLQSSLRGASDAFAATVNLGSIPPRLEWATYLGGTGAETVRAAAPAGGADCLYVAGSTTSADLPVRRAVQPGFAGAEDGFLARICTTDVLGQRPAEEILPDIEDQLDRIEERVNACDCAAMQAALASLEASAAAAADDHARLQDALDAILARLDAMDLTQREALEREIERALFNRDCVPWLWLPEAQGGKLETALALIGRRIDAAVASGSPGVNERVARERLADAVDAAGSSDAQRACRSLCDALHAVTTP